MQVHVSVITRAACKYEYEIILFIHQFPSDYARYFPSALTETNVVSCLFVIYAPSCRQLTSADLGRPVEKSLCCNKMYNYSIFNSTSKCIKCMLYMHTEL